MSEEFNTKLGVHTALAFIREIEWFLKALVSSHPAPEELLKYYESHSDDLEHAEPFSNLSDDALEPARRLRQELLAKLRQIVETRP